MMTGCGIGISTDHLQNFVADKICLSIVVIRNPIVQPVIVAFFFFFSSAGNLAVKVEEQWRRKKERETYSGEERERHILFFLGLKIGMECNK